MNTIQQLKGAYQDETIYVLGAGRQMEMYRPEWFKDRICIGVNWVYRFYPVRYTVARHMVVIRESPTNLIYPDVTCDFDGIQSPRVDGYRFCDEIHQSGSTTLTAIDAARYMGASRIVIVGCECYGPYFSGYPTGETNQTWLSRSRSDLALFIDLLERREKIRIDWLQFIPEK